MRATSSTAIVAACIWLVSCGRQAPVSADIILTNGRIFTGGAAGFVEALAVRGENILSVGTTQEINARATEATRRIDLDGRLVIPGINDAHVHMDNSALPDGRELKLDSMDPTCAQVIAALKTEIGNRADTLYPSHVCVVVRKLAGGEAARDAQRDVQMRVRSHGRSHQGETEESARQAMTSGGTLIGPAVYVRATTGASSRPERDGRPPS